MINCPSCKNITSESNLIKCCNPNYDFGAPKYWSYHDEENLPVLCCKQCVNMNNAFYVNCQFCDNIACNGEFEGCYICDKTICHICVSDNVLEEMDGSEQICIKCYDEYEIHNI